MITDDIDVAESFNEKFVSISKTLAASIDNVPFTTHGITTNKKSPFFIQLMALRFRGFLKITWSRWTDCRSTKSESLCKS